MFNHSKYYLLLVLGATFYFTGCQAGGEWAGREYMPDMAHSNAYEYYSPERPIVIDGETVVLSPDGMSARQPAKGTVPRGFSPYPFEDTPEGYEQAGAELFNPMNGKHAKSAADGKNLYITNCAICHGEKGDGQGEIVKNGKYPGGPPSYFIDRLLEMPEGKMFHSMQYGKNNMGSYAGQLNKEERWKIVSYIKDMQAANIASSKKITKDEALKLITGRLTYKDVATYTSAGAKPAAPAANTTDTTKVQANAAAPKKGGK